MGNNEYIAKTEFVSSLGISLHHCGATSHRIERNLESVCDLLGIHGTFLVTPTSLTFCYWRSDPSDQHIQIERVQPSAGDLGKLDAIDTLIENFAAKQLDFGQMKADFDSIRKKSHQYSGAWQCLAWVMLACSFSALMSASLVEIAISGLITSLIYLFSLFAGKYERTSNAVELIAAMLSGLACSWIASLGVPMNVPLVILSTVIIFVPGLALTVALSEIAHRDLVSGTSKLVHAMMTLLKLYFGAMLGVGIGAAIWGGISAIDHSTASSLSLPSWAVFPAVFTLAASLIIAFNIRVLRAPWCIVCAMIGFYTAVLCETHFGIAAGMFSGALTVGVFSNFVANWKNIPASLVLSEGLILLVPGSKTYIILDAWITGKTMLENQASHNQTLLIFISLVMGLLCANVILPSRKSL